MVRLCVEKVTPSRLQEQKRVLVCPEKGKQLFYIVLRKLFKQNGTWMVRK